MRIVCQQTILMKYRALFVIFEKKKQQSFKIWNCCLLQIIGGTLKVITDSTQEISQYDCKIVDWKVKHQHKQSYLLFKPQLYTLFNSQEHNLNCLK